MEISCICKKYLLVILAVILFALSIGGLIYASDTSNAQYMSTILITDNGSTPITNGVATFNLSTADMITAGMLSANASDLAMRTAAGIDIAVQPSLNATYPWCTWVDSIPAYSSLYQYLYTKDVTGGKIAWFPGDAGGTVTDNNSMEMGGSANWTFWDTWFNPASTGKYLDKSGAISLAGNASGNLTANVYVVSSSLPFTGAIIRPNAAGDSANLTPSAGANWQCAGDNNDATYVDQNTGTYKQDLYNIPNHTTETGTIDYILITLRGKNPTGTGYGMYSIKTHGVSYNGTEHTWLVGDGFYNYTQNVSVNPYTGAAWTWTEIDALQLGELIKSDTVNQMNLYEVWMTITYELPITYSISGSVSTPVLSAAEHDISVWVASNRLAIAIDGTIYAVAYASSVLDNGNAYTLCSGNITPYVRLIEFTKAGVQKGYWWYQNTATFTDQSGNGNTLTPSRRTAGNNNNLVASVITQDSTLSGNSPSANATGVWLMIGSIPPSPDNMFTEGGFAFPGGSRIVETADALRQNREEWLFAFVFALAIIVAVAVYGGTHVAKMGQKGSLILSVIAAEGVLIYFYRTHTIPGLALIPFGIIGLLLVVWRKSGNPVD